jgi:regulator of sigma E protease
VGDFRQGDRILRINDRQTSSYADIEYILDALAGQDLTFLVYRDGAVIELLSIPSVLLPEFNASMFDAITVEHRGFNLFTVLHNALFSIFYFIRLIFISLIRLVTLRLTMNELAGPIGIVTVIGDVYAESIKYGFTAMFLDMSFLAALLSANLAVFNLLPIPALDGGRMVFLLIEMVTKKQVKPEHEGMIHFVGFALLIVFAVFIAYNDVVKLLR